MSRKRKFRKPVSMIKQKDGSIKQIHKFKRKKRFGRSLNNRAPAKFLSILEQKVILYNGKLEKIETKAFRASQYDHSTDTYTKCSLNEREKYIDGNYVQRDLYSAFLIKNTNNTLTKPDRDKCIYEFETFLKMQNELINWMKFNNISKKQCFGF